jgi:aromatic ring-opening dioxygenase catalytic subunit (LigB family)
MYLPHGGGPAFFMQGGMHDMFADMQVFLEGLRQTLPATPKAILVITAHWETDVVSLTGSARPELIYDYYGFPPETYSLQYAAPASPELAAQAAALLQKAGIANKVEPAYGWDHGVFIPLKVMFPQADIPVVAMSLQAGLDPLAHAAVGRALRPLRDEGVLIVGSGMSYHNLRDFRGGGGRRASEEFDAWLDTALAGDDAHRSAQLAQWSRAPSGRASHPREEHLLPLMVASGAGSDLPAHKMWSGDAGDTRVSAWSFA